VKNNSLKKIRKNFSNSFFSVQIRPQSTPHFRSTILVSKALGNAVNRNRLKRIFREFIRQNKNLIPQGDVICRPRLNAAQVKNHELFAALKDLFVSIR
jgi:ribonuclease P protein component